jgi:hypothetical protein
VTTDERDELIWELSRAGLTVREIADGLTRRGCPVSKSTVHRVLSAVPSDDDDDDEADDEAELFELELDELYDDADEHWPTEPFRFVGYERQCFRRGRGAGSYVADCERWVDGDGRSIGIVDEYGHGEAAEMALWRYRQHVANELGEYERADALADDWQRQREAYAARTG